MADAALFIGWGAPVRGREGKGLEVFGEATAYYAGLQEGGQIESWEAVLLEPHGGELDGFILLRGSRDQLDAAQATEEFERMTTRAGLIVENLGVVHGFIGTGLERAMGQYQTAIGDLGG